MNYLNAQSLDFAQKLQDLLAYEPSSDPQLVKNVDEILHNVKQNGDIAVLAYAQKFDHAKVQNMAELEVSQDRLQQALSKISLEQRAALESAATRLRTYAERQKLPSWEYLDEYGNLLGQNVTPLDRVGIYVPGGKAAYPSSVLMNAIPAKVAGVSEIIMCSPTPDGELNELVLAAAFLAGVDRVFTLGGAHAVGALAYGTATIPAVDKITGPGNAYVAAAKRAVFGRVGIDMIAGPSEILVICDGKTNPEWIAVDLFSQAEHDETAQAILISPDSKFLDEVAAAMTRLMPQFPRQKIIHESIQNRGALILVENLDQACDISNQIAPEHLELSVDHPENYLPKLRHAGAIFMGRHTPEAFGDYCAGPNHVLPTAGTARFSSPLGVYDFQKRTSLIGASAAGARHLAQMAAILADGEGLHAHAESARLRG